MINCQMVLDDIVTPITDADHRTVISQSALYHYCYGAAAGKVFGVKSTTDNWFCCETTKQKDTTGSSAE